MSGFFSIGKENIQGQDPRSAAVLFKLLLWAEARAVGVPISKISITERVTVPDGGIDASVEAGSLATDLGLIKEGYTAYQLKTGDGFKPWQPSSVKKELFDRKVESIENLTPGVRECFEKNGSYIAVLFDLDPTSPEKAKGVENIIASLKKAGFSNPKVEVWGQQEILGYIEQYPSLKLRLNGRATDSVIPFDIWKSQDNMRLTFVPGEPQNDFISSLREKMRDPESVYPVRVIGEAGIGKTRLVFESVSLEDLNSLVIYFSNPEALHSSSLVNELVIPGSKLQVILIVDECEAAQAYAIWDKVKICESRAKLVTIFNEDEPKAREEDRMDAPSLDEKEITKIIESYSVPEDQAKRFAPLCEDSPRVAHIIGQNLKENPDDLLRQPGNIDVWGRFIAGRTDSAEEIKKRTLVLQHISLFKKFGYGRPVEKEGQAIQALVAKADPSITAAEFNRIVSDLKKRKILQGGSTLYITPRAFHIWLWGKWWETQHTTFVYETFIENLPPKLKDWFYEMFQYAAGSKAATKIVEELLGEGGPFADGTFLNDRSGSRFFLALTEGNPEAALKRLEKIVGKWTDEQLLKFREGRQRIVWALERIAIWGPLFIRAAKVLLKLAANENDTTFSNNATGTFGDLFRLGNHNLASSEAPPSERFPVLVEALRSENPKERIIAIRAFDEALDIHYTKALGAEHQGLRQKPKLWAPKTWTEIHDAYREAWNLLHKSIDSLPEKEQKEAIKVILKQARSLGPTEVFGKMVVETVDDLLSKPYADKNEIITAVIHISHYARKETPPEIKKKWQDLKNKLIGDDFHSQLNRYVALELFEDQYDEDDKKTDRVSDILKKLSEEVIAKPVILEPELDWLATTGARNGYSFGYNLGSRDIDFKLFRKIISAYEKIDDTKNPSLFFLTGYLRAMYEKNIVIYEKEMDTLARSVFWQKYLSEITWRSGVTDKSAQRITNLIKAGILQPTELGIFLYGASTTSISEPIFIEWLELLIGTGKRRDAAISLSLFDSYYVRNNKEIPKPIPKDLGLRLLLNNAFFHKPDDEKTIPDTMEDYYWGEISQRFIKENPDTVLEFADKIISNIGESGSIADYNDKYILGALNEATKIDPKGVWKIVIKNLDDKGYFLIKKWLSGGNVFGDGPETGNEIISLFPLEEIWKWVDEDVEKRAWYLASIVPKDLSNGSLAHELLVRYGQREEVKRNLMANFSTEGWSGRASEHYERKKADFEKLKETEKDPNVKNWIEEYVSALQDQIERAKIDEERDDY